MKIVEEASLPLPLPTNRGWPWTNANAASPLSLDDGAPWPRISIVTPSYNQGEFIEKTIRSVLLQNYPNLEYIIIDGGSTDDTVGIIKKYSRWLSYWRSEPDEGQSAAINVGFSHATGEILGWLNSDDLLLPGALHKIATLRMKEPTAVAWIGCCARITPEHKLIDIVEPRGLGRQSIAFWHVKGFFYQPACFFAADAFKEVGCVDESLRFAMDLDLWLKLAKLGQFTSTSELLSAAIIHENAKTTAQRTEMNLETMMVQVRHGFQEAAQDRMARLVKQGSIQSRIKRAVVSRLRSLRRVELQQLIPQE